VPRPILFLHSSGPQGPGEGSEPLARRLREELGPDYGVVFPVMPGTADDPHYEPWRDRITSELEELEGDVIIVGHSLGASVALQCVAEGLLDDQVSGLVLAETPLWGTSEWEKEWALPKDWPAEETRLPPTFMFHSRDDEEIPFTHLDLYAKKLPGVKVQALDGTGHLLDRGDLSELVAAIRSL
jgi:predicted alpha/beta hydrolase family esterase